MKLLTYLFITMMFVSMSFAQNLKFTTATLSSGDSVITLDLSFDTDATTTEYLSTGNEFRIVAIQFNGTWQATSFTIQASDSSAGQYDNVYDIDGTQITLTMASDRYIILEPRTFAGIRYLKLIGDTQETADVTYTYVRRQY